VTNPIAIAAKGKGYLALIKRGRAISGRYGLTPAKMDRALELFVSTLQAYECGASFPITASTLARHGSIIKKYQARNIEFAIHGLFHIDYSRLSSEDQYRHIKQARQIFHKEKIHPSGFRCPYLRWNEATLAAVANNELSYDSSQALHWDVVDEYLTEDYQHVLHFYGAKSASDYPALPKVIGKVVQIPYCVPDDEALVERLRLDGSIQALSNIWLAILSQSYELGELFTLGLHPERIGLLHQSLTDTLAQARSLSPQVWMARLDEITDWWRVRSQATFEVVEAGEDGGFHMKVNGPPGITVLARHVEVKAPTESWHGGFHRVAGTNFHFRASKRPCIGLSPGSDPGLLDFLKQQGYWAEISSEDQGYSIYLNQAQFSSEDERPVLRRLAHSDAPLIRLGRWPDGAQSAVCVTGDIDALTLWDYGLRLLGT
jgi:peptidoglycan/xylan/chitin deacetylase (PgdA/CDA1 family)